MDVARHGHGVTPWVGAIAGFVAWAVAQQASTLLVERSCSAGWPWPVFAVCVAAVLVAGTGMFVSWRVRAGTAADGEPGEGSRLFIAALSAGLAAIFILAILAQMLAAALFTGCER